MLRFSYDKIIDLETLEKVVNHFLPLHCKVELDWEWIDDEPVLMSKFVVDDVAWDKFDIDDLFEFVNRYKLPLMEEELELWFVGGNRYITPATEFRNAFHPLLKKVFGGDWKYSITGEGDVLISVERIITE